jgi:hypothetical protein
MISSSARSAPAAFIDCRMESKSCGPAPNALIAFTTSESLTPAFNWIREPPPCLNVDLALRRRHRLSRSQRIGLAHLLLGTDHHRKTAMGNRTGFDGHRLIHDDRAGPRIDDHFGDCLCRTDFEILEPSQEGDAKISTPRVRPRG